MASSLRGQGSSRRKVKPPQNCLCECEVISLKRYSGETGSASIQVEEALKITEVNGASGMDNPKEGIDDDDDELMCFDAEHLMVGDDPGIEEARYDCYCGEGYSTRTEYKEHLAEVNYEQVKRWAENLDKNTEKTTIGEGMKDVIRVCEKIRTLKWSVVENLTSELEEVAAEKDEKIGNLQKQVEDVAVEKNKIVQEKDEAIQKLQEKLEALESTSQSDFKRLTEIINAKDGEIQSMQREIEVLKVETGKAKLEHLVVQDKTREAEKLQEQVKFHSASLCLAQVRIGQLQKALETSEEEVTKLKAMLQQRH